MTTEPVLISRCGTLIKLSHVSNTPLPHRLTQELASKLSFNKKVLLRGEDAYSPDGTRHPMQITRVCMYSVEGHGFMTGFGFLTKIVEILRKLGIESRYVDMSGPRARPDCYQTDWNSLRRHIAFRPRQEECVQIIERNECGLITAAPGFGKTTIIEALCHLYPKAKFHIIIPQKDVATNLMRKLCATIPNVGMVGGGSKVIGQRVTVFTAGSIHHSDGDADFLLCDEVQNLMTDNIVSKLGLAYTTTRNFAFTATPSGRMDGADAQIELMFGPQIFYLPYQEAVDLGLVVPIRVRWLPIDLPNNPCTGLKDTAKLRHGIWRNRGRNQLIAHDVRTNYSDLDTQILILCATVDHAIHLWQFLPEFALCHGEKDPEDLEYYIKRNMLPQHFQATNAKIRNSMRENFQNGTLKRVIATDVWATGVDFAALQVLYRIDARESEILDTQAPGRVSRIHNASGKLYGEVIDCYDKFDSNFRRKSDQRRKHYAKLGWYQTR